MTQFDSMASKEEIGRRLNRLPLVLLLTVGLLFSILHCAGCGFDFATADTAKISTNLDHSSAPDTPEQQLPCHSDLPHFAYWLLPLAVGIPLIFRALIWHPLARQTSPT